MIHVHMPSCQFPGQKLCTFAPTEGFPDQIDVFINPEDNTRFFSFGKHPVGTQSRVKCGAKEQNMDCFAIANSGEKMSCDNIGDQCFCVEPSTAHRKGQFGYIQTIANLMDAPCGSKGRFPTLGVLEDGSPGLEVLMIGLGGGNIAQYLQSTCLNLLRMVVVETDLRVVRTAQTFFGLNFTISENTDVTLAEESYAVVVEDGGAAVHNTSPEGNRFDVVIVDCFVMHGIVPPACSSNTFVHDVEKILKPGGLVLPHVWKKQEPELAKRYETVFGSVKKHDVPITTGLNFVLSANKKFTSDNAATQLRILKSAMRHIEILQYRSQKGMPLTNLQVTTHSI